jgi:hypothetical protein
LENNAVLQREATDGMRKRERVAIRLFVALVATFGIGVAAGLLGFGWVSLGGMVAMGLFVAVGVGYLIPARAVRV